MSESVNECVSGHSWDCYSGRHIGRALAYLTCETSSGLEKGNMRSKRDNRNCIHSLDRRLGSISALPAASVLPWLGTSKAPAQSTSQTRYLVNRPLAALTTPHDQRPSGVLSRSRYQ